MQQLFKMPKPVKITGRTSSVTNAFVNGIIPCVTPTDTELNQVLTILEMEDGVVCAYCGGGYTEWDHFRPLIENKRPTGYISESHNLVQACGKCNQSKGNSNWKEWMLGDANLSPKTRNIADLEKRIERLEHYEAWSNPKKVDFEAIVGNETWSKHWDNCENLHHMMKESQMLSDEIKIMVATHISERDDKSDTEIEEDFELKVSMIVKTILRSLLESNLISSENMKQLESPQYCKDVFGVYYPVLKELDLTQNVDEQRKDSRGYNRYYKQPVIVQDKTYLLCSEWSVSSKEPLANWISDRMRN